MTAHFVWLGRTVTYSNLTQAEVNTLISRISDLLEVCKKMDEVHVVVNDGTSVDVHTVRAGN